MNLSTTIVMPIVMGHSRPFIRHNYHDHSHVTLADHLLAQADKMNLEDIIGAGENSNQTNHMMKPHLCSRGGVAIPFPTKLHLVVSNAEKGGYDDIVSWQPHGRCFTLHKPEEFVSRILSTYFGQTKITSFQRQLNMYGFLRLTKGPDRGCYYHELFLKHKLFLCQDIVRIGIKGSGVKVKMDHSTEPNFYEMPFVQPEPELSREIIELSREYERQQLLLSLNQQNEKNRENEMRDEKNGQANVASSSGSSSGSGSVGISGGSASEPKAVSPITAKPALELFESHQVVHPDFQPPRQANAFHKVDSISSIHNDSDTSSANKSTSNASYEETLITQKGPLSIQATTTKPRPSLTLRNISADSLPDQEENFLKIAAQYDDTRRCVSSRASSGNESSDSSNLASVIGPAASPSSKNNTNGNSGDNNGVASADWEMMDKLFSFELDETTFWDM